MKAQFITLTASLLLGLFSVQAQITSHFPNGQVMRESQEDKACACIKITTYHDNGKVAEKYSENIADGKRVGSYTSFFANGSKENVRNWDNGVMDGAQTSWYLNGKIRSETLYAKGQPVGTWNFFDINGQLEYTEAHAGDTRSREFYFKGEIYLVEVYKDGLKFKEQIVNQSLFDEYAAANTDGQTK